LKHLSYILLIIIILSSCNFFKSKKEDENVNPVARVYDKILYEGDLKGVGANAASPEDSVLAVKNYIDSWIRRELILKYAEENLPTELDDIEKQIEKYRQSLIIYTYEKELIKQKLDDSVTEKEISDYYEKYKEAFSLKTGIYNLQYIKLKTAPRRALDSARVWLKKPNEVNNSKLENFCEQYAVKYVLNDSSWFEKDEIENILPINNIDWDDLAFNKQFLELKDSLYLNLVKINNVKFKGSDAPLSYVRKDISAIIINKRKLDYITQVHNTIYEDALKNKKFEIFNEE